MVADFVSADYGWLQSPDGKKETRVLFRCGKGRDGYFTNDNIHNHATSAMDILDEHYSSEDHVLVFDNVLTHLKRADTALTVHKMPKHTPKDRTNWGVDVNQIGADGKPIYAVNGKICKRKCRYQMGGVMGNHSHSISFQTIHMLVYSREWPLFLRNVASRMSQIQRHNARTSNV
jgi:hypothetical protein